MTQKTRNNEGLRGEYIDDSEDCRQPCAYVKVRRFYQAIKHWQWIFLPYAIQFGAGMRTSASTSTSTVPGQRTQWHMRETRN
jgi:hypothetical protein